MEITERENVYLALSQLKNKML